MSSEIDEIIRLYYADNGGKFCAQKAGISRERIARRAQTLGIKVRPEIASRNFKNRIRGPKKNPKVKKDDVFSFSKESCYVLGFLWGDGYIYTSKMFHYKVGLDIASEDFEDIEQLFFKLGKWHKKVTDWKQENRQQTTRIQTNSKSLYEIFEYYGYKNKSVLCPELILKDVPEENRYLWWRGYSDADGCFYYNTEQYKYSFNFAGNYNTDWSSMHNMVNSLNCQCKVYKSIRTHTNGVIHQRSSCCITGKNNLLTWIKFLYPELIYDSIGLYRKFDKALKIYNHFT